jgi:hypothetical protein
MKKKAEGHHLVLGTLRDLLTGRPLEDTHDERYRQKLARLLLTDKGYSKKDILPRRELTAEAGDRRGMLRVDFLIRPAARIGMIIQYGPGSLVTRHRPALAISRLVAPYQVPIAVAANGEDADILDGATGKVQASGLAAIPSRAELLEFMETADFPHISDKRAEMESRILYTYEIDGACPCDTTVCRI